jgi:hypothetical protein
LTFRCSFSVGHLSLHEEPVAATTMTKVK